MIISTIHWTSVALSFSSRRLSCSVSLSLSLLLAFSLYVFLWSNVYKNLEPRIWNATPVLNLSSRSRSKATIFGIFRNSIDSLIFATHVLNHFRHRFIWIKRNCLRDISNALLYWRLLCAKTTGKIFKLRSKVKSCKTRTHSMCVIKKEIENNKMKFKRFFIIKYVLSM